MKCICLQRLRLLILHTKAFCVVAMSYLMKVKENGNMKGLERISAALCLVSVLFSSCQEELMEPKHDFDIYNASVESFDGTTKTELGVNNEVLWSLEDRILIFEGTDEGKVFQIKSSYVGKSSGEFQKVEGIGTQGAGTSLMQTVAVYPYDDNLSLGVDNDEKPVVSSICFPLEQAYTENSFANGSFPMTAVAPYGDNSLSFKNVGGVLKLNLTGEYAVSKITLTGKSDEPLAGNAEVTIGDGGIPYVEMSREASKSVSLVCDPAVRLDPDNATPFYISLPPTDFSLGFKVVIYDSGGKEVVKTTNVRNIVYRSKILVMPEISAMPAVPYCEAGVASGVTPTSAVISCSFVNIPEDAEYGIRLTWDGGERSIPIELGEGSHNVEVSGLEPGMVYSYWAYIEYDENIVSSEKMEFETEKMDVTGMWTCVETDESGKSTAYTVVLQEDGAAVLNIGNNYENSVWSSEGKQLIIDFTRFGSTTYSSLKLKVNIDESCAYGTGTADYESGNYSVGGVMRTYHLAMTHNQNMCETGVTSDITQVSARITSYYNNVPSGAECGIVFSDGITETRYSAEANDNSLDFFVSGLEPGTSYSYWAYVKYDDKFIMGEVCDFETEPMDVIGIWTCVEMYSSGTTDTYTVELKEGGTASIYGRYSYGEGKWRSKGNTLSVYFGHYSDSSGHGVDLVVDVDVYSSPLIGAGSMTSWAENWNTGGSSRNSRDFVMTKNDDICSTGEVEDVTVTSAIVSCIYNNAPSGARCGVGVSINGEEQSFYANGTEGTLQVEITGLNPGTVYSYWAFVEFGDQYIKGDVKEFTTESMDVIGVWLCKEIASSTTEYYTVDLNENGTVTVNKADFVYESAQWYCIGTELHLDIAIIVGGPQGDTFSSKSLVVEIEDPYNPVYGTGKSTLEVINTNTLGSTTSAWDLEMTKQ